MPSGSKKRKAAKKKKAEEATSSNSANHLHVGEDEIKRHGEKDGDGEEISTSIQENESIEQEGIQKGAEVPDGGFKSDRDLKSENDDGSGNIVIVESGNKSNAESSQDSTSTNSSSDDDHLVIKSDKVSVREDLFSSKSASIDDKLNTVVVESVMKENGDKKTPLLDEETGELLAVIDSGSVKHDVEVIYVVDEDVAGCSEARDYLVITDVKAVSKENEDQVFLPEVSCGSAAEHSNDSEIPSSDHPPVVISAPPALQPTSWKSCCGLFELFAGSDR